MLDYAVSSLSVRTRSACRILDFSRTAYKYQPDTEKDFSVIMALQTLEEKHPAYGIGLMFDTLRREGKPRSHKRGHRIYKALKLHLKRKGKRRLPSRNHEPLTVPERLNQTWSIDFMSDALLCGRRFRTFNVVEDFNREALAIKVTLNLSARRVIRVLEKIGGLRGYPQMIRMDIGSEFISKHWLIGQRLIVSN